MTTRAPSPCSADLSSEASAKEEATQGKPTDDAITEAEIAEITARAEAATPGPWLYEREAIRAGHAICELGETLAHVVAGKNRSAGLAYCDATFIAHARTDVPRLLAALRSAQAKVADQAAAINCLQQMIVQAQIVRAARDAAEAREQALNRRADAAAALATGQCERADALERVLRQFIWVMDQKLFMPDLLIEAAQKARAALVSPPSPTQDEK